MAGRIADRHDREKHVHELDRPVTGVTPVFPLILDIPRRIAPHHAQRAWNEGPCDIDLSRCGAIRESTPSVGAQIDLVGIGAGRALVDDHDGQGVAIGRIVHGRAGPADQTVLVVIGSMAVDSRIIIGIHRRGGEIAVTVTDVALNSRVSRCDGGKGRRGIRRTILRRAVIDLGVEERGRTEGQNRKQEIRKLFFHKTSRPEPKL